MKLATAAIVLSVAALLFLPLSVAILDGTPETRVDGWQYDDYRPASNTDVVSGAFELVNIGGTNYIHAKDVGSGTINGESYNVSRAQLDLAFMCGQSNAAYRNPSISEVEPVPKIGTAYYFGLSDRSGPLASENDTGFDISSCKIWPMVDPITGDLRIGDKGPAYSATYYEKTGHKVLWVCGAIGNKAINQFLPGQMMWEYQDNVLSAALSMVDDTKFELNTSYYLWCQGEANASTPVESYISQFVVFNDAMMAGECAGVKFDGAIISLTRSSNGGNATIAQDLLSKRYSNVIIGSTAADGFTVENGLMGSDNLHYSQLGNNIIGVDLANCVIGLTFVFDDNVSSIVNILKIIPVVLFLALIIFAVVIYRIN